MLRSEIFAASLTKSILKIKQVIEYKMNAGYMNHETYQGEKAKFDQSSGIISKIITPAIKPYFIPFFALLKKSFGDI